MANLKKNTVYVIYSLYDHIGGGLSAGFNIGIKSIDKDFNVSIKNMIKAYKTLTNSSCSDIKKKVPRKECTKEETGIEITADLSLARSKISSDYKYIIYEINHQFDRIEKESNDINELRKPYYEKKERLKEEEMIEKGTHEEEERLKEERLLGEDEYKKKIRKEEKERIRENYEDDTEDDTEDNDDYYEKTYVKYIINMENMIVEEILEDPLYSNV